MYRLTNKLLVAALLMAMLTSCSSDSGIKGFFSGAAKTENFEAKEYRMPAQVFYSKEAKGFLYDKFFPIGWSSDGRFAYFQQLADEACGCTWIFFRIYDVESQKNVCEIEYNDHGAGESIETIWKKIYPNAEKNMFEHKIVQYFKFNIHSTKFGTENVIYELILHTERASDPEYSIEFVKKASIELVKQHTETRPVSEINYSSPYYVLDASVAGIVLSPNGLYGTVIYKEEKIGYEGPPQIIGYSLIGVAF